VCANRGNILRQYNRGRKGSQFIDPEFAEALYEDKSSHSSSDRQAERKAQQFCRQVQRALNLAFADRNVGDGIDGLFVEEVLPAPDCGRLLVHVVIPTGLPILDAMAALGREVRGLRSEVASAISRKRAPELCFAPAHQDGGGDE
jgi:ribosome-binding factor A